MKKLIVTMVAAMAIAGNASALPVLNSGTAGAEMVTVLPDHENKNLYYLAPTVFVVAKDSTGAPNFSYIEYYSSGGSKRAVLQTTLRPDFSYEAIEKAKAEIRKYNPAATFTALPFESTKVNFTDALKDLMIATDCKHQAGTVADEQTCAFKLSRRGIKVITPMLRRGLAIATQFAYQINGVRKNADGSYQNQQNPYQVAGRIGGTELAQYPELFRGADGRPLPNDAR